MNARLVTRLTTSILLLIGVGSFAAADLAAGLEAFRREDYATALRELTPPAAAGDSSAQFHLGQLYARGLGVEQNHDRAAQLYTMASNAGMALAQYELGSMYFAGSGVPKDNARAVYWYERAAEQGLAEAQFSLGLAYDMGVGTVQDPAEAVSLYRRASEQGHQQSQLRLGLLLSEDPVDAVTDYEEAVGWLRMAADRGEASAQWRLGWIFARGEGGKKDYAQAIPLLQDAARQGNLQAQFELGLIYEKGRGYRDPLEARKWYKTAAIGGSGPARKRLTFDPRLRSQHLSNARIFDGSGAATARVRDPEELRAGPPTPVPLAAADVYCDFYSRKSGGGHPKFRCFMMTGPRTDHGRYYDELGNVRPEADAVLILDTERGPRPVLAAENDAGKLEPLTERDGFARRFVSPFELKVKYRLADSSDPVHQREMYSETAATRLMWTLHYPADRVYLVSRVHCHRCPRDPFSDRHPAAEGRYTTFEDVAIELRYGAGQVEDFDPWLDGGWSWGEEIYRLRHGSTTERFSPEQATHFDGLVVLMNIVQQVSKPPHQNRLICLRGNIQQLGPYKFCPDTVLLVHDLGATFGRRQPDSLKGWREMPVWANAETCEAALPMRTHDEFKVEPYVIGKAGQEFILGLLDQLSDEHLRALFESAGFERFDLTLAPADEQAPAPESRSVIDAWIAAFHEKVEQVRNVSCEGS